MYRPHFLSPMGGLKIEVPLYVILRQVVSRKWPIKADFIACCRTSILCILYDKVNLKCISNAMQKSQCLMHSNNLTIKVSLNGHQ